MGVGTWFAYCVRERLIPLDELKRRLSSDPELSFNGARPDLLVCTVHDPRTGHFADVTVGIDTGRHVVSEAEELADKDIPIDFGVPPPDLDALRHYEARYELFWDLRYSLETYNAMMFMVEILSEACDAIVYDMTNRRYV